MTPPTDITRRTTLKLAGAAATAAVVAGCSSADDTGDDGNGNGGNGDVDGVEIDPGTEIVFYGDSGGWEGVAPDAIEGETNPTLILEDGEDYTIGWSEGDGIDHNIELRDANGDVVGDYETPITGEPSGDGDFIDFEATDEIAVYRCSPHSAMEGDIVVE